MTLSEPTRALPSQSQGAGRSLPQSPLGRALGRLGPAWPLKYLLVGFPIWWALGVGSMVFFLAALAMGVQLLQRGRLRAPAGFGLWVLFLAWMLLGVFVLWADAPGTISEGGIERLAGFGVRVLWYLAVTVAVLYPLSLSSRSMPALAVCRWLGSLFLVAVFLGVAGVLVPSFGFTSPAELIVPGARSEGFIRTMVHPSLTTSSDFLGYEQPRPRAPFAYPNAWGNNVGLLLPFFVYAALRSRHRWQRWSVPAVLGLAAVPIAFSLNRGLWLGLCVVSVYTLVILLRARRYRAAYSALAVGLAAVVLALSSPLADTVTLRLDTPHSNERRTTVGEVVTRTTWQGSPLLGFGTTREVQGNFASISGGQTPTCRQCAAPPLGTQGLTWRLILTTGFVGTALFAAFMSWQFLVHVRRRTPMAVLGCMTLTVSGLFFFVYDSLGSPLFILMMAIGLMNRERIEAMQAAGERALVRPAALRTRMSHT